MQFGFAASIHGVRTSLVVLVRALFIGTGAARSAVHAGGGGPRTSVTGRSSSVTGPRTSVQFGSAASIHEDRTSLVVLGRALSIGRGAQLRDGDHV
ncbi:MAG: hypothetical protein U1E39_13640 [Planctomycetota bacterium]